MSRIPSFHLTIQFVGECLFVPDFDAKTMHVLMPYVTPTDNVPPHVAAVCVEGRFIGPHAPDWTNVLVNRVVLALPSGGDTLSYEPPSGLVPVGAVANAAINPLTLLDDPQNLLTARMDLQFGTAGKSVPGGCWEYPYPDQFSRARYTYAAKWDVGELDGDSLDLNQTPLAGGTATTLPTLVPAEVDGRKVIEVLVCHAPADELPPFTTPKPPKERSPAYHFAAFYNVFVNPAATTLPKFFGDSCIAEPGGNPYTCMGAQSPLTPG